MKKIKVERGCCEVSIKTNIDLLKKKVELKCKSASPI